MYKRIAMMVVMMVLSLSIVACGDAATTTSTSGATATTGTGATTAATMGAMSPMASMGNMTMAPTTGTGAGAMANPVYNGADTTITFWQTHNATETPVIMDLVNQFQTAYPKIKVKVENVPFDGARDKYQAAASSNAAPDVFRADIGWTPAFAQQGLLLDITSMVKDRESFLEAPFGSNVYNGKVYGLPQVTDVLAMYYNKAIFTKAGITKVPETMAEFQDALTKIQALNDGTTAYYPNFDSYFVLPYLYAFGGNSVDADKKVLVNSAGSVSGLQFLLDLKNKAGVTPKDIDLAKNYDNAQNSFIAGKTAVIFNGPWASADIIKGLGADKVGIGVIPKGPNGAQGSSVGGHNYLAYAGTKNAEASYVFMQWMTMPAQQAVLAQKLNLMPTRKAAYDLPEVKANAVISDFGKQLAVAKSRPNIPENSDLYKPMSDNIQAAVTGAKTAQQALDDAAKQFAAILKK
jgi:arabinogalactan oligomer/maltooligosaccharide transport system substrate-binding protein